MSDEQKATEVYMAVRAKIEQIQRDRDGHAEKPFTEDVEPPENPNAALTEFA